MYELVGPYLVEWTVVGEQCSRDGNWTGSWCVHWIGARDCGKPISQGSTGVKHSFCEAMTLAKQQALAVAAELCALE